RSDGYGGLIRNGNYFQRGFGRVVKRRTGDRNDYIINKKGGRLMRPVKLTMTAFGPYKDTETINFKELDGLNIFVISGATGAGKTTIFDAICFALYGSASGTDRENIMMLRSHFANDDVHTKVEFVFEIKGRFYRVLRQIGHVKSGNKTKTGDKYELYEQIGTEEIPCVDRQMVTEIN